MPRATGFTWRANVRLCLLAAALAVVCLPGTAAAQDQQPPGDGRRTVTRLPANLLRATVGVFGTDNLKPVLIGSASTGMAALFDDAIVEAIADPDSGLGQTLETGGGPLWSGAAVGVIFVAGRFADGRRFRDASYDWLDAYIVNGGYTMLLKEVVRRERPNGQDNRSFPSGHASNAFALAVVAARHYGWKVGVPAYGVAAIVALSRLQQNAHYVSDVVAGATLGYIVGRTVVRVNNQPEVPNRAHVGLSPLIGRGTRGLVVEISF